MKPNDIKPPVLLETLEQAHICLGTVSAIYDLAAALDPHTPGHQAYVVQTMAGPRFRVAAAELRRIFGTRRRPRGPTPVGSARREDKP
jgi:hypothetical protein